MAADHHGNHMNIILDVGRAELGSKFVGGLLLDDLRLAGPLALLADDNPC